MAQKRRASQNEDRAKGILKEKALRVTKPRVAVLAALLGDARPVSHADVTEALLPDGLDRVTIYRTLLALTEAGVLVKTDLGDHVWRFSMMRDTSAAHGEHAHFICVDCGAAKCLPEDAVSLKLAAHRSSSVIDIQVRGRCEVCVSD